ncbi:unnamed protein product [Aspergillus oryzae]|uniref:glucan 1,3-beta-glucosidase n=1 Tax=Aspergillus oryzae TaxID=5062 RepID=A0AAN5BT21_ASPOZ|nr:unnamed protein product [Aspergillus oryzae]
MRLQSLIVLLGTAPLALAWLPTDQGRSLSTFTNTNTTKIRGVNLGSHFIMEKWMASSEWSSMGCGDYKSEWDCVKGTGQDAANAAFKTHWQTWITKDDITRMYVDPPQFYQSDDNAERAYKFYEWIREQIHNNRSAFKNVGALELVNEPLQNTENADTNWMVEHFYPSAIDRIRAKESVLGVSDADALHVTLMKEKLLFDDHNYEIYLVRNAETIDDMITDACGDNRTSNVSPKVVGEWSLAFDNTGDNFLPMTGDHAKSYSKWFSAQQRQYEALDGWVFWSWKTDTVPNIEQWNYQSMFLSYH